MKVLEKLEIKSIKIKSEPKFQVVILEKKLKNESLNVLLGRPLSKWVAFACREIKKVNIVAFDGTNILETARPYVDKNFDFTIVLLSTTPLIDQSTIGKIMEYCRYKNTCLCKLPVGYVLKNESVDTLSVDSVYSQDLESFYEVENKKQYNFAEDVLVDRINSFHISNGVDIKKPKTTYIEPEVDIDSGVVIYTNNSIKGNSKLGKNTILKENNVITASKIGKDSCVSGSVIEDSVIGNGVYISSFCEIKNSIILDNSIIGSGSHISGYTLDFGSNVKANSILGEESDDTDSGSGESR